jgi:hypothetical protein
MTENDLVYRLRKRAEIRRQIPTRKSVQENQPDRIADLLEEAANTIEQYMTDKGYEVTTHEKQAEFDKKRNYNYDKR